MPAMTRGPLPPGTYWRRRVFVVSLAVISVFVVVSFLRGGSDGSDTDQATQSAAEVPPSDEVTELSKPQQGQSDTEPAEPTESSSSPTPLPVPAGQCEDADILVTPVVAGAVAGRDVTIVLNLRTRDTPACTWSVSAKNLTFKISDSDGDVWASRQCPGPVPKGDIVVRQQTTSSVSVTWNSRYSESGCPKATEWALPGDYEVSAAALGGEPGTADFNLDTPSPQVIEETPSQEPSDKSSDKSTSKPSDQSTEQPSDQSDGPAGNPSGGQSGASGNQGRNQGGASGNGPGAQPSGAVEP